MSKLVGYARKQEDTLVFYIDIDAVSNAKLERHDHEEQFVLEVRIDKLQYLIDGVRDLCSVVIP